MFGRRKKASLKKPTNIVWSFDCKESEEGALVEVKDVLSNVLPQVPDFPDKENLRYKVEYDIKIQVFKTAPESVTAE